MNLERDFARLSERLKANKQIQVEMNATGGLEETVAYGLISKALSYINQIQLEGSLHLIISELLKNAEQALLKREFAATAEVPTNNQAMLEKFGNKMAGLLQKRRQSNGTSGDQIILEVKLEKAQLMVHIRNAGEPDALEKKFIQKAIEIGSRARSMADLIKNVRPSFQGEGMGIPLAVFALRQAGITPELFSLVVGKNETIFSFEIPVKITSPEKLKQINQKLLQEIKTLPAFPEQVRAIQQLCESKDSNLRQVANAIQRDQAIASQIIKLANSGGFGGGNVIEVFDAVKVVGLKNISEILLQIGALGLLMERYGKNPNLTEHPVRVGIFSRALARLLGNNELGDRAYISGLLHDLGKVVLLASIGSRNDIDKITHHRDRRSQIQIEELTMGVSHALVGALLAHKWKFPEILKCAIEFHHSPTACPAEYKDIVYIVYMANCMADYLEENVSYYSIEPEVLSFFNMTTPEAFQMTATMLENEYQSMK